MDVARSKNITWYGIDFSKARFIGFESYVTPEMLKDELIKNWADHTAQTDFSYNTVSMMLLLKPANRI